MQNLDPEKKKAPERSLEEELNKGVKDKKIINMPVNNKLILDALQENEDGDAFLLIKTVKNRYLYDCTSREWYYWNDHFWRLDVINQVSVSIKKIINMYGTQLKYEEWAFQKSKSENDEKAEKKHEYYKRKLKERINVLSTVARKKNVLKLASEGLNSLAFPGDTWDQHPMLLVCKNGCIDLAEGTFNPGEPLDYIKTVSPAEWISYDTPCPSWEKFLSEMFSNDQDIVDYIQRLLGYGITGLNTEHIFPIFWGSEGRNGKGTLFEILKFVLGDLAYKAPSSFLMEQQTKSGSSPDAVTMGFMGKRIVWCSETNEKDRLDVAKLKELVGGDTLSARAPYARRQIEFIPTHLLLTITNRRPKVPANDMALWRRIHLIALKNSFVDNPDPNKKNEFKAKKGLLEKLKKEGPGILAWLVRGCLLWQKYGLNPPDSINNATSSYKADEDILGHFLNECCCQGSPTYQVKPKILYDRYKNWCSEVGHHPMAKKRFSDDMKERFGNPIPKEGIRTFRGVEVYQ